MREGNALRAEPADQSGELGVAAVMVERLNLYPMEGDWIGDLHEIADPAMTYALIL